jgi:hypothetical protein
MELQFYILNPQFLTRLIWTCVFRGSIHICIVHSQYLLIKNIYKITELVKLNVKNMKSFHAFCADIVD